MLAQNGWREKGARAAIAGNVSRGTFLGDRGSNVPRGTSPRKNPVAAVPGNHARTPARHGSPLKVQHEVGRRMDLDSQGFRPENPPSDNDVIEGRHASGWRYSRKQVIFMSVFNKLHS